VVASYLVAKRSVNTLILVHLRELLFQWIDRLNAFLDVSVNDIGQIGGGKRKPTGIIDVATIQSLGRKGVVDDIVAKYGHLVVDECHHISARSFEIVARQCKAKFVTGLSATVTRKDGHHPIIFMNCEKKRGQIESAGKSRQRVGGESPPHGNG
jgi:superfamily II DNA or RNA helicase